MTQKFGRNYRLTIYPIDGGAPIVITPPFTVDFTCNRNINSSVNELSIDIYNLSLANRIRIFQDLNVLGQYQNNQLTADGKNPKFFNILFEAGYAQLYRVFYGRMMQASSARAGTNIITRIDATSSLLDIANTSVQTTLAAGQKIGDVLNRLIQQYPNLQVGAVGNYPKVLTSPVTLNGNCWDLLKRYGGIGNVYEDNGSVYILNNNEALEKTTIINDATGLLQTPRRQSGILQVTTLLETSVDQIGQQIQLQSSVQPEFNGIYKVNGIAHMGTISAAVCGNLRSIFTLQANWLFNGFTTVKQASAAPASTPSGN